MNWYEGQIPGAIELTKNKKCPIVVYITGNTEQSKDSDALWEDVGVLATFKQNDYVALKLQTGSEPCKQFSDIYPVIVVPCTYIIADNGIPIDMIPPQVGKDEFIEKLTKSLKKFKDAKSKMEVDRDTSAQVDASAAHSNDHREPSDTGAAMVSLTPTVNLSSTSCSGAVAEDTTGSEEPAVSTDTGEGAAYNLSGHESPFLSNEEKIQRARELMAEKRARKVEEEKQKEKQQEQERRELGHSASKLSQMKKDHEVDEMKKKWKKEKEADRLARERVREQIALDRAEKNEAFQKARESKENTSQEATRVKMAEAEHLAREAAAVRNEMARIQFRLPDGSCVTHNFPAADTLSSVDQFICNHMACRQGEMILSTPYPRLTFTSEHRDMSMVELGLIPSAVIMVIPEPSALRTVSSSNLFYSLVSLFVAPITFIWRIVYGFLFGFPSNPDRPASQVSRDPPLASGGDRAPAAQTTPERPQTAYKRRTSPAVGTSRREGNIHRFTQGQDDDDDDNATWNGNSTQQM